jgi:hypothetical protein
MSSAPARGRYLSRKEAMGEIGLWCASLIPEARKRGLLEVRVAVACRLKDGTVVEAEGDERLHAEIQLRLMDQGRELGEGPDDSGFVVYGGDPDLS